MPGLELKSVDGIWHVAGTIAGERVRKSLGTRDRKQAEELRAQYEARLWKRHTYGEEAVRTFEEAALSYMEQGGEGRYLVPILKHFRGRVLGSIKPGEIRSMAKAIYPRHLPSTMNRQAIVPARAVIMHAHDLGWCAPIKVKMFEGGTTKRRQPVTDEWMAAFLAQADKDKLPHLAALVLFMNRTGTRVSEAIRVQGEHVDLKKRMVLLERTKEDEWETRHLTSDLVLRIAQLGLEEGKRVFDYTDRCAVNRRIKQVCKRAEIAPSSSHAAGRHSFGTSAMALPGARLKDVMEAGGWKSAKLFVETYVHSTEGGKNVAAGFDAKTGPIGKNLADAPKRTGYRFGKKG